MKERRSENLDEILKQQDGKRERKLNMKAEKTKMIIIDFN